MHHTWIKQWEEHLELCECHKYCIATEYCKYLVLKFCCCSNATFSKSIGSESATNLKKLHYRNGTQTTAHHTSAALNQTRLKLWKPT